MHDSGGFACAQEAPSHGIERESGFDQARGKGGLRAARSYESAQQTHWALAWVTNLAVSGVNRPTCEGTSPAILTSGIGVEYGQPERSAWKPGPLEYLSQWCAPLLRQQAGAGEDLAAARDGVSTPAHTADSAR